jgi:hypothetical protein
VKIEKLSQVLLDEVTPEGFAELMGKLVADQTLFLFSWRAGTIE